jgi:hypothetical protein
MTASVVILKADLMTFPRECRFGLRVARRHSLSPTCASINRTRFHYIPARHPRPREDGERRIGLDHELRQLVGQGREVLVEPVTGAGLAGLAASRERAGTG